MIAALKKWIEALDPADPDYEHHLLEALWVYEHHDTVEPGVLDALLEAKEFRARAAATRVLQHWFDRVDGALTRLKRLVNDPEPRVRLEAVRALSFVPTAEAAEIALDALRHPIDYYLQYTLDSTMTTLEKAWKPALTSGRPFAADNPEGLVFLLGRLDANELLVLPKNATVLRAIVDRPGSRCGLASHSDRRPRETEQSGAGARSWSTRSSGSTASPGRGRSFRTCRRYSLPSIPLRWPACVPISPGSPRSARTR